MDVDGILVRFWGVRGSIACAGSAYHRYGGNTSCLEVRVGERVVILDAGTGLRALGSTLVAPLDADLLLTHTHVDHIEGIPFFRPLFDPRSVVRIRAGHLGSSHVLHDVLAGYMSPPLFPVPPSIFTARVEYHPFDAGETLELHGLRVRTAPLQHPNGATGYRLEHRGRSFCYVTDTEHTPGRLDPHILELVRGADVMVYDSTFTDEEFPSYVGWGHSTWQEGVRLCEAAGVDRLLVFHHDPSHQDEFLDRVAAQAAAARPGTVLTREGMELYLPRGGGCEFRGA